MPSYKRPLLILNPKAGACWSRTLSPAVTDSLRKWLPSLRIVTTDAPLHAMRLAEEGTRRGCDLILAAGGDGTVNEVINGMVGTEAVLAILPCGTGNSMAREIGLPLYPLDSVKALLEGEEKKIYLGRVGKHHFGLMVGIGFDGDAVRRVSFRLKRFMGRLSYVLAGSISLFRYRYPDFTIITDEGTLTATTVVVAKSRFYASRFQVAPQALLASPRFQVCVFKGHGAWNYLKYVLAVMLGHHDRLEDVVLISTREICIERTGGLMAHADGDPLPTVPSSIQISKRQLKVLFPKGGQAKGIR